MALCVNSGLAHAPDYTPHRVRVLVADAAAPTVKTAGMSSDPYEDVYADVKIANGSPSIDIAVLLWSEQSQAFLAQQPAVAFTALTASKILKFATGGNRFFLMVTGTFTGGVRVDINCAGTNPVLVQGPA